MISKRYSLQSYYFGTGQYIITTLKNVEEIAFKEKEDKY
jgi:hypothetical protein